MLKSHGYGSRDLIGHLITYQPMVGTVAVYIQVYACDLKHFSKESSRSHKPIINMTGEYGSEYVLF